MEVEIKNATFKIVLMKIVEIFSISCLLNNQTMINNHYQTE